MTYTLTMAEISNILVQHLATTRNAMADGHTFVNVNWKLATGANGLTVVESVALEYSRQPLQVPAGYRKLP